jgi:hypothetical protein
MRNEDIYNDFALLFNSRRKSGLSSFGGKFGLSNQSFY